jgi:hypothetical protein
MKRTELAAMAVEEAVKLKGLAKEEELENLDPLWLDVNSPHDCIYGQLTGDCYNSRATFFLNKCAVPIAHDAPKPNTPWRKAAEKLSERKVKRFQRTPDGWRNRYSAIELYICLKGAENDKLIRFLKGKTSTLKLR